MAKKKAKPARKKKAAADPLAEVWRPSEMQIYRYFNGEKVVGADPVEVAFALQEFSEWGDVHKIMAAAEESPNLPGLQSKADAAFRDAIPAIRKAFGVKPYDDAIGKGLTAGCCWALYTDFMLWVGLLKKKHEPLPSSVAPTAAAPSAGPSPMPNLLGSLFKEDGWSKGEPILSPEHLPEPSAEMRHVWEKATGSVAPASTG